MSAIFSDVSGVVRLEGSLTGATPAADAPQWATVLVTSAQILALHTTAKTLVAAPGAGKVLVPLTMIGLYTAVTTPYVSTGNDWDLIYAGLEADEAPNGLTFEAPSFDASQAVTSIWGATPSRLFPASTFGVALAAAANRALALHAENANPTGGNGTLTVSLLYAVLTL